MGYLSVGSSTLPDFSKAVISFWVRIPSSTLAAVAALPVSDDALDGSIPFVTFGEALTQTSGTATFTVLATAEEVLGGGGDADVSYTQGGNVWTPSGDTFQVPPTFVGASVFRDGTANLAFNIQLPSRGGCSGLLWTTGSISMDDTIHVYLVTITAPLTTQVEIALADPGTYEQYNIDYHWSDVTGVTLGNEGDSFSAYGSIPLSADMWHHVLISFDISGGCSATGRQGTIEQEYYPVMFEGQSATIPFDVVQGGPPDGAGVISTNCKLWIAVDDVNYTGMDLTGNDYPSLFGFGPNSWPTNLAVRMHDAIAPGNGGGIVAGELVPGPTGANLAIGNVTYSGASALPSYSYAPQGVPINGKPLGIPASAAFVNNIFKVEMAEFQMFTGVSMDTGVEANRRAFIARGADGSLTPVNPFAIRPPADPTEGLDPHTLIAPGKPHKLLGKPADIVLTSASRNWIGGINTGTSKDEFKATGTIKAFLPNPKVGS